MKAEFPRSIPGRAGLLFAAIVIIGLLGGTAESAGLETVAGVLGGMGAVAVLGFILMITHGTLRFVFGRYNRRYDARKELEAQQEAQRHHHERRRLYSYGHRLGAMPYRLNSPPGWPQTPADWVPEPGWEPDRSWPTPPEAWQLWQRTQPRPRHQPRSAWDPHPSTTRMLDNFDGDEARRRLCTAEGRVGVGVEILDASALGLQMRMKFDAEPDEERGRSRWHPVEWSYRHAADAVTNLAQRIAHRVTGGLPEEPAELTEAEVDDIVRMWRDLNAWLDELADAAEECYDTSRAPDRRLREEIAVGGAAHRAEASLDPGPAAWQQAEHLAAATLRQFGFDDAAVTGDGTDRGLDVVGSRVAAQVKYTNAAVGRPVIQQLVGAAGDRQAVFFSRAGFTEHALEEAHDRGMALFEITLPSSVKPRNLYARQLAGA